MSLPNAFKYRLAVPVMAAPMFLVSGPELILEACKAGVAATIPALNARQSSIFESWLAQFNEQLSDQDAPYGVNLILHASNQRREADLALCEKYKVPYLVTSLGHPGEVVKRVHDYGGLVFSDVIHAYHARKVIDAGVDGIIAVSAGAGGHAGTQSLMSLIREIREFWNGTLIAAGAINDGAGIRAAEVLGADLAYMGTRFIATKEAQAQEAYKTMLTTCGASDVVYSAEVSGTPANFLRPSLLQAGFNPNGTLPEGGKPHLKDLTEEAKAWRDVWSAGHGVSGIHDVPAVAELVSRLSDEYEQACCLPRSIAIRGAFVGGSNTKGWADKT